jgi:very-short-patch-repair endonuclease
MHRSPAGVQLHGGLPEFAMTTPWIAGRMQAMWQAIRCLDEENAIAALESAIRKRFLSKPEIAQISALAPVRLHDGISHLVDNSESGLETITRLRLLRAGFDVVGQAVVPGLGHQDRLINDAVALEIDGEEWHGRDQSQTDRERDLHAARLGRHTIRLTSDHVLGNWPDTLTAIERAVADSQHLQNQGRF